MHAPSSADEFFKSNKGSEHIDIFDMITRQPPPFHQHQLNIETPYFEDFATPLVLPPHEVSSDDVESYFSGSVSTVSSIEPLDDEFVPPPQPPRTHTSRKRKHDSISPTSIIRFFFFFLRTTTYTIKQFFSYIKRRFTCISYHQEKIHQEKATSIFKC